MVKQERPLSPSEAAQRLGFHVETIRRWLKTGRMSGWRAGDRGHWLISELEIRRMQQVLGERI